MGDEMTETLTPIACCAPLAAPVLSDEEAKATAELFRALADPARVRILNVLATTAEPVCVCHLVDPLRLSQPTVSHHLKKLVDAGLLEREQRGKVGLLLPEARGSRAAGQPGRPYPRRFLMSTTAQDLREEVRRRYAESAGAVTDGTGGCGCGSGSCCADGESDVSKFGEALYDADLPPNDPLDRRVRHGA
jgi:ArsR family transcriptional regulator